MLFYFKVYKLFGNTFILFLYFYLNKINFKDLQQQNISLC